MNISNIHFALADMLFLFWPVLIFITVLLILGIMRSTPLGLYLIIFLVFFGNTLEDYGLAPAAINSLAEVCIIFLFLKSILTIGNIGEYRWFGFVPFVAFLFISLVSLAFNRSNPLNSLLFLRVYFRYYFLLVAVMNLNLTESQIKKINLFLLAVVVFQAPVAFAKFVVHGAGESTIGTYEGHHGGSQSTSLPLIVIGFCIGYYLIHRKNFFWVITAAAFAGYSIVGGKRGFFFYLPLFVLFWSIAFSRFRPSLNTIKMLIFGVFLIFVTVLIAPRIIPTLNPDKVGLWLGDPSKKGWSAVWEYATKYNAMKQGKVSYGRLSTTLHIFDLLSKDGMGSLFLGKGPSYSFASRFTQSTGKERISVGYGMTDFSRLVLLVGIAGMMMYFLITVMLFFKTAIIYGRIEDRYWKSFAFGCHSYCSVMIVMGFTYSQIYMGDTLSCIFFYTCGALLNVYNKGLSS